MIGRIVLSVVVGVAATLVCLLLGALLVGLRLDLAVIVATFLGRWSAVIGVLVALAWFFGAPSAWGPRGRP